MVGAKTAVFGLVALIAMTLASFAAFYGALIFLGPDGHGSSLSDPGALRSVTGVGLYLTLVGLLGAGFGWIVRSTAGAISALVGLLLILPNLIPLLGSWAQPIVKYMPGNAGESFVTSARVPDTLAPVTGIGVLALWVAAAFGVAAVARAPPRRDLTDALCFSPGNEATSTLRRLKGSTSNQAVMTISTVPTRSFGRSGR